RQGARRRRSFLEDGDRLAPSQFLRIVDLAQVQQRPLHHTASAYPAILHDPPVTVLFAVLLALGVTEKHDAAHDTRGRHPEVWRAGTRTLRATCRCACDRGKNGIRSAD